MKQLMLFFCIPFIIIYLLVRCAFYPIPVEKTNITDYQYMYEGIVDDWNSAASLGAEREDIFGFGEYLYNSYLLLFPRETPSTLNEYYLRWVKAIDYDDYAIYFTCELSEPNYNALLKNSAILLYKTAMSKSLQYTTILISRYPLIFCNGIGLIIVQTFITTKRLNTLCWTRKNTPLFLSILLTAVLRM